MAHRSPPSPAQQQPVNAAWHWAGFALLLWLYLFVGVFDHELWPPTEQAFAGVTWEMFRHGEIFVPHINGLPYLEKPPLAYLLSWLSFSLAGEASAGLLRLPVALLGLAALGLLFWAARRHYGDRAAWIATLICASTANYFGIMHRASTDAVATAFAFTCFAVFLHSLPVARQTGSSAQASVPLRLDLLFCLILALSFFVKNFYSFLIVVPPVTIFLIWQHDYLRLLRIGSISALLLISLLLPWAWALYQAGGEEYLRLVFVDNTLGRFLDIRNDEALAINPLNDAFVVHKRPFWFFIEALASHSLPWFLIYGLALVALFRRRAAGAAELFLKISFVAVLFFVSLSSSKVSAYYLPVIFIMAMAVASYASRELQAAETGSWPRKLVAANLGLVVLLVLAAPMVGAVRLDYPALYAVAVLNLLAAAGLWVWQRRRKEKHAGGTAWLAFVSASLALSLNLAIPLIDKERSWRPFFELVQPELAGRALSTTMLDDRTVPAMNFYLDQRISHTGGMDAAVERLASDTAVAIIVINEQHELMRPALAAIPHRARRSDRGKDRFTLLTNQPNSED